MDLVSVRSNSVFENDTLKEKYNHSNNQSPFKVNPDCLIKQRNSDSFIKKLDF